MYPQMVFLFEGHPQMVFLFIVHTQMVFLFEFHGGGSSVFTNSPTKSCFVSISPTNEPFACISPTTPYLFEFTLKRAVSTKSMDRPRHGLLLAALLSATVCAAVIARCRWQHRSVSVLEVSRVAPQLLAQHRAPKAVRVSYAGIVPYIRNHNVPLSPRAVVCGGGSSVGCVLSIAEDGLQSAMASEVIGPGRLAVEQAARGKGFAPWHVSHQNKAARVAARHAVAVSSGNGHGPPSNLTSMLSHRPYARD